MARYRVLSWREIPSLVEASDETRTIRVQLSQRFQDLIDSVAVRVGATSTEAYLDGWAPGEERERPGSAESVAAEVAAELEAGFERFIRQHLLNIGPPTT